MGPIVDQSLGVYRALADQSRLRILALLRSTHGSIDVREVAAGVALHPNTVREHLNVLVGAGLVTTRTEKRERGRPRTLYRAPELNDRWLVPLHFERLSEEEALARSRGFLDLMSARRSVREFSGEPVPRELLENALRTAASAPSGANKQPWHFVVVSDPAVKAEIRAAAEHEEKLFYADRANEEYLRAIEPMAVTWKKEHLTAAPYLIAVFQQPWALGKNGVKETDYYVRESVGIAVGFLLTALHASGLAALPYAPAPMRFLNPILRRPERERAFLLIAVGYPAPGTQVPALPKKPTTEVVDFF